MSPRDVVLMVLMVLMVIASWASLVPAADFSKRYVHAGSEGRLVYEIGPRGDRMPDYSHAGYRGGGVEPPLVPAKVIVGPVEGDDTAAIQRALDHVATLPADEAGFRGAVLLCHPPARPGSCCRHPSRLRRQLQLLPMFPINSCSKLLFASCGPTPPNRSRTLRQNLLMATLPFCLAPIESRPGIFPMSEHRRCAGLPGTVSPCMVSGRSIE